MNTNIQYVIEGSNGYFQANYDEMIKYLKDHQELEYMNIIEHMSEEEDEEVF